MIPRTMNGKPTGALFHTTRWSLVGAAADDSAESLELLCKQYWFPVYAVARRAGNGVEEAKDLTQGFFAKILEKGWLGTAEAGKGRFRSFLVTAFKRYMVNEWHYDHAAKRGGLSEVVPLDAELAERLYLSDNADAMSPDALYDRRWALTMLDGAMARLKTEYVDTGRTAEYVLLMPCLTAERGSIDYPEISAALKMSEGAARVAVHRIRKRYRTVIRDEIGRTVSSEAEVDEEMRELFRALM